MSYYYNYYLGYKKDGKIYPLGPYNCFNEINPIVSRSRSFASDLYEYFYSVKDEMITKELDIAFGWDDYNGTRHCEVRYLPISELPTGSYLVKGYFPIREVNEYEELPENEKVEFEWSRPINPYAFIGKLQNKSINNENIYSDEDEDEDEDTWNFNPSDYMFYMYPNYYCKEYEVSAIMKMVRTFDYSKYLSDDSEIVVLETEG